MIPLLLAVVVSSVQDEEPAPRRPPILSPRSGHPTRSVIDGGVRFQAAHESTLQAPVTVADTNGDGIRDVLVTINERAFEIGPGLRGRWWVFSGADLALIEEGPELAASLRPVQATGLGLVLIEDAEDGRDLVVRSADRSEIAWRTWPRRREATESAGTYEYEATCVGDVDGDACPDLVVSRPNALQRDQGFAVGLSGADGEELWRRATGRGWGWRLFRLDDADGDGCLDVVAMIDAHPARLELLSGRTGEVLHELVVAADHPLAGRTLLSAREAVDLNGDGIDEFLLPAEKEERALFFDPLTGLEVRFDADVPVAWIASGADVDGDGREDMAFATQDAGSETWNVRVWSAGLIHETAIRIPDLGFGASLAVLLRVAEDRPPWLFVRTQVREYRPGTVLWGHPLVLQDDE